MVIYRASNHVIRTLNLSLWLCLSDCTLRLHVVASRVAVLPHRCRASAFFPREVLDFMLTGLA